MKYTNTNKVQEQLSEIKLLINQQSIELLDLNQAAEYLKLKPSYVYSLIHQKKIPYYKPNGKRVYFNKAELNNWVTGSRIKTVDEIEKEYKKQNKVKS